MTLKNIPLLLLIGILALPFNGTIAASTAIQEADMKIIGVRLDSQPMVFVTETTSMEAISAFMGPAFAKLGQFLATSGVTALGPPMAVYHDWSGEMTAVDLGFPVSATDAEKATGEVLAGMTPGGYALKIVHIGPYDDFAATYAAIGDAMKAAGVPEGSKMWEVYLSEPGVTPDAELVTEIFVAVSEQDAAKFPRE